MTSRPTSLPPAGTATLVGIGESGRWLLMPTAVTFALVLRRVNGFRRRNRINATSSITIGHSSVPPQDCDPFHALRMLRSNTAHMALRQSIAETQRMALRDQERAWIADRDKACAPPTDGGTADLKGKRRLDNFADLRWSSSTRA